MSVDTPRGGSCRWIAPELLDDCPASTASDVWAFGMTTLELFTRTVPFPDCHGSGNVFGRFKKGKLPPRPTGESTQFRLTDALWNVCTSCWESGPSLRPKMKSILEEVKAISICTLLFPQVLCVLTAFSQSQTGPAVTPFENSTPARPISKEGERATRDHRPEPLETIPQSQDAAAELNGLERLATDLECPDNLEWPGRKDSAFFKAKYQPCPRFYLNLESWPPAMLWNDLKYHQHLSSLTCTWETDIFDSRSVQSLLDAQQPLRANLNAFERLAFMASFDDGRMAIAHATNAQQTLAALLEHQSDWIRICTAMTYSEVGWKWPPQSNDAMAELKGLEVSQRTLNVLCTTMAKDVNFMHAYPCHHYVKIAGLESDFSRAAIFDGSSSPPMPLRLAPAERKGGRGNLCINHGIT